MNSTKRRVGREAALLAHELDVVLATVGLTLAEYRILAQLELGVTGNGQLARMLGVTPPTVTAVIDGLERRALVTRRRVEQDRRRVVLELSAQGVRLLRHADEAGELHLAQFLPRNSGPDLASDHERAADEAPSFQSALPAPQTRW